MRVLIVEDEQHVSTRLVERIGHLTPSIDTVTAGSRTSGIEALQIGEFDFIVCDLRLPPQDGGVDTDETHGLAVYQESRSVCPGTPCLFFTGFGTSQSVLEQLSTGGTHDVFGNGQEYGITRLLGKDSFLECVERIKAFNTELATLEAISINFSSEASSLDLFERRALQLQARSLGGTNVEVGALGGLSGARALKVCVRDNQGTPLGLYFAKIDLCARIRQERENYRRYISSLLKIGGYPSLGSAIEAGIGKRGALFYQLADEYTESLFDVLERDESEAVAIIQRLRDFFDPWTPTAKQKVISVRELREHRLPDSKFEQFRDAIGSPESFEEIERELTTGYQHGDLHGFNVLCSTSGKVVVIDFGSVGPAPACIDPIILELSVLFHRDSPFRSISWPAKRQIDAWFNLEEYLLGCPIPGFIRKCREWANGGGEPTDLPPVVYAEAVRQLKYGDTDHERALGIARAAIKEGM